MPRPLERLLKKLKLFLIDDTPDQLALLTAQLERSGAFTTEAFSDASEALRRISVDPPNGVVCDLAMPDPDGLEVTRRLRASHPLLPVVIATGAGSAEDAAACFEAGAADFVTKPIDPGTLIARIRKAVRDVPARELLEETARARFDPDGIVGTHPRVREVREFVATVAGVRGASVLILGASGTGKNLVARAIHAAGDDASFRFVEVNCAALPAHLLEAELFGYEKGAFTDARQTKKGLVEEADGGTLFLDEIGTMPLELQAKLLSFLESRAFRRIGSTEDRSVDLRVVAATNSDLAGQVRAGAFREDLFYRLNVASVTLPALRAIPSDIGPLARHFAGRAAAWFRRPAPQVSDDTVRALESYDWPGNARELRNVVERAMIFQSGPVLDFGRDLIETGSVAAGVGAPGLEPPGREPAMGEPIDASGREPAEPGASDGALVVPAGLSLDEVERRYIQHTLAGTGGHVGDAAQQLGVTRKVFWTKRKRLGLI